LFNFAIAQLVAYFSNLCILWQNILTGASGSSSIFVLFFKVIYLFFPTTHNFDFLFILFCEKNLKIIILLLINYWLTLHLNN
jgi:uncharacterized membrane protein